MEVMHQLALLLLNSNLTQVLSRRRVEEEKKKKKKKKKNLMRTQEALASRT
jgi:hypothetical protein